MGRTMVKYSTAELFRLWHDDSLRTIEVANQLGVSQVFLYTLARRHHLPKRNGPRGGFKPPPLKVVNDPDPEPFEEQTAGDSLALSPWVEARVASMREQKLLEMRDEPVNVTQCRVSRYRCGRA